MIRALLDWLYTLLWGPEETTLVKTFVSEWKFAPGPPRKEDPGEIERPADELVTEYIRGLEASGARVRVVFMCSAPGPKLTVAMRIREA